MYVKPLTCETMILNVNTKAVFVIENFMSICWLDSDQK